MNRRSLLASLRPVAAAALVFVGAGSAAANELTIYAGAEADNIKYFSEVFSKAHPNIKLNWVRDSTGIIQARVLAEKDNPRADVLFAMAVTSMTGFAQMGMFQPYTPKGMETLNPLYLDKARPANWVGIYGWASTMCFNTVEARRANLPRPAK